MVVPMYNYYSYRKEKSIIIYSRQEIRERRTQKCTRHMLRLNTHLLCGGHRFEAEYEGGAGK